jgi:hypothetical protein
MLYECPFCLKTFSSKNAYSLHRNFCFTPNESESGTDINDSDINDMSLDSEGFSRIKRIGEVL